MEPDIRQPHFLPWQTDLLEKALRLKNQQRLPHAILIETHSDQDISQFVCHLSMLLLCDSPQGAEICGTCDACRMMSMNTYADFNLVTLEPDEKSKKINKNIKIDQIRNLIHKLYLTAQYDRLKIAAIYPAEKMSIAGANSLLKTLEEPATGVLLLLVTHNKGRVPVTVRSRCQSWVLNQPTAQQALDWLEEQGISGAEANRYLNYAGGDPVLALNLKQQNYSSMVEKFKSEFSRYLRGEMSVAMLCSGLLSFELPSIRRLINMTLSAYCYQMSGVDAIGNSLAHSNKIGAQAVLGLQLQAQKQLLIEENNLDLQLQLEDVLISLKHIITRRSD